MCAARGGPASTCQAGRPPTIRSAARPGPDRRERSRGRAGLFTAGCRRRAGAHRIPGTALAPAGAAVAQYEQAHAIGLRCCGRCPTQCASVEVSHRRRRTSVPRPRRSAPSARLDESERNSTPPPGLTRSDIDAVREPAATRLRVVLRHAGTDGSRGTPTATIGSGAARSVVALGRIAAGTQRISSRAVTRGRPGSCTSKDTYGHGQRRLDEHDRTYSCDRTPRLIARYAGGRC